MNIPNIKLAREIMEAVPEELVDLDAWKCGTHACLLGHMALSGKFPDLIMRSDGESHFPAIRQKQIVEFDAGAVIFDISWTKAARVFGLSSSEDGELSHKAIALARLDALLAEAGEA